MKTWLRLVPFVLLVTPGLRCSEAPTEPLRLDSTPTPIPATLTPTPAELDLNGTWSGTFRHNQFLEQTQARVRHRDDVDISFGQGWWWFSGALDADGRLDGELHHGDRQDRNTFVASISGTASATSITLETASGFYSLRLAR